jgi:hypothetical protein
MLSSRRLRILALLLICALIMLPISLARLPNWDLTSSPAIVTPEVQQAYSFLSSQPGYFRVMIYDRYREWVPMYTSKGSVDGWYDQATSTLYRNFTYDLYYVGVDNVNLTSNALRLLGVRYIVVFGGYGYGQWALPLYNSSAYAPPAFHNDQVSIYEVTNSRLIYFAGSALSLDLPYDDIAQAAAGIAMDPQFSPDGLALIEGGCGASDLNATCYSQFPLLNPEPVDYGVSDLSWTETEISFRLNASGAGYAVVASAYFPGWTAELDGRKVPIWTGIPNEMVIRVDDTGEHAVAIRYGTTLTNGLATIVSAVAWLALAVLLATWIFKRSHSSP